MISKFKKRSYKLPIAAVVILIIIGVITFTNSKSIGLTGKNSSPKVVDNKTSAGEKSTKDVKDDSNANNSEASDKTDESESTSTKTASNGESSSNQSKTTSSVNNANEVCYGSWHLGKIVATSPVTAMDEKQMQSYMGTKIAVSKESFSNAKVGTVNNPKYVKSTISNDQFYTETKMELKRIGVDANSVQRIEVQGNDGSGEGCIYVTENGSMITNIDGVFYKIQ